MCRRQRLRQAGSDGGKQRVAVAVGMTSPIWPTQKTTEKVVVLGLR
jgi:hypothetical protein